MARPREKLLIGLGLIAGLAVCGGALVKAQQPQTPVREESGLPPTITEEAPPPPSALSSGVVIPQAAPVEASDVEPAPPPSSAEQAATQKPDTPMKRPRYGAAVIQALDKVTAQTIRFEAPVGKAVRYKTLIFVVHACETTAPDEAFTDAAAHIEIDSQPLPPDGKAPPPARQVFQGWMFANSPGLNLFQHPVYDAWLIACKTDAPSA